ncbi:MAG: hypothetical protein DRP78_04525 [Candidatus Omnitrophota bacterium]|nr:MAG: hypothetical protein DRP78_04525 [Candidatus Omnitrophota bacterium]
MILINKKFQKMFSTMLLYPNVIGLGIVCVMLILFLQAVGYAQPQINLSADKSEISVGENLTLKLKLKWQKSENNDILVTKITQPEIEFLEKKGSKQAVNAQFTDNKVIAERVIDYFYVGKQKGEGQISPAIIEYVFKHNLVDKQIIKSDALNLKVISRVNGIAKKILSAIGFLSLTGLFLFLFFFVKKYLLMKAKNKLKIPEQNLEKEFLAKMQDLYQYFVRAEERDYCAKLTQALSDYLEQKYSAESDRNTEAANTVPELLVKIFQQWKDLNEKSAFAGYKPSKDEIQMLVRKTKKYFKEF